MEITPEQLRELGLLHAETLAELLQTMKQDKYNRRGVPEFEELLELAVKTVTASDDAVFDQLSKLEEFLRYRRTRQWQ